MRTHRGARKGSPFFVPTPQMVQFPPYLDPSAPSPRALDASLVRRFSPPSRPTHGLGRTAYHAIRDTSLSVTQGLGPDT